MMAADTEAAPQRLKPDPAMIAIFTDMVLGYCEHFVPVRALAEKGGGDHMPHTPFMENDAELAGKLAVQAGWAADNGMALFVVPGTVLAAGEAKAEHIAQTQVVLVISIMATSAPSGITWRGIWANPVSRWHRAASRQRGSASYISTGGYPNRPRATISPPSAAPGT